MLARSYSRNSGRISCDTDSGSASSSSTRPIACSFSGLANENSVEMAIDSAPLVCDIAASTRRSLREASERSCRSPNPLLHAETHATLDQRRHALEGKIVELGPVLTADFDRVFESGGSYERHARAFALQQRVGANRGSVQQDDGRGGFGFRDGFGDGL